jgi:hypothetical protein
MASQVGLVVSSAGFGLVVPLQLYRVVRFALAARPLLALT